MKFDKWLDRFISEKGLDLETMIQVETPQNWHLMPLGVLVQYIKSAPLHEKQAIQNMLVRIDFRNGDVMHYFRHLAQGLAHSLDA